MSIFKKLYYSWERWQFWRTFQCIKSPSGRYHIAYKPYDGQPWIDAEVVTQSMGFDTPEQAWRNFLRLYRPTEPAVVKVIR